MSTITERVQQVSQMKGIDAAAVVTGFAVWAEYVPVIVGVFTIAWLGMQMVINAPRMCAVVATTYRWLKARFAKD